MHNETNEQELTLSKSGALVVAHPDGETLWAGGTILNNPLWKCYVFCLCRKSDIDHTPKFYNALKVQNAEGTMGDIDDEPEQLPFDDKVLNRTILELLPPEYFDLIK